MLHNEIEHNCDENILVIALKDSNQNDWIRIRERQSHRHFEGRYVMCRNFMTNTPCAREEMFCSYAHSAEEQRLWG